MDKLKVIVDDKRWKGRFIFGGLILLATAIGYKVGKKVSNLEFDTSLLVMVNKTPEFKEQLEKAIKNAK